MEANSVGPEVASTSVGPGAVWSRIKLEIPFCKRKVHAKQKENFKKAFDFAGFVFKPDPLESEVEEPGCQKFLEIIYEVSTSDVAKSLLKATKKFLELTVADRFNHNYKANVVVHSQDFFSLKLEAAFNAMPVCAIFFGNIQGGVFLNHAEICFDEKGGVKRSKNKMTVDFEFDRQDMIVVRFKNTEMKMLFDDSGSDKKTKQEVNVYYQVVLQRSFIRRIIVDNYVGSAKDDAYGPGRTRIHFELNCPPFIKSKYVKVKGAKKKDPYAPDEPTGSFDRCKMIRRGRANVPYPAMEALFDSPVFTIEFPADSDQFTPEKLYRILSRLRVRCGVAIEFSSIFVYDCLITLVSPYCKWSKTNILSTENEFFQKFLDRTIPKNRYQLSHVQQEAKKKRYSIRYLIECLLSRGAVVKDQLLLSEGQWIQFIDVLTVIILDDFALAEMALERVVVMIDERKRFGSITKVLLLTFNQLKRDRIDDTCTSLFAEETREGYQKVRKIIFTPTRVVYVVPEMMMGNRVLRQYDPDGTKVLRVSFRDDDNAAMRKAKTSEYLIKGVIERYLGNRGYVIAGITYAYLGSSNSQMRDTGAYFMEKNSKADLKNFWKENGKNTPVPETLMEQIHRTRRSLGRFEVINSIPKMMARLGQCFTQSRPSTVELERCEFANTYDVIGGASSYNMAVFTFSDGVGMISQKMANELAADLKFRSTPTCFQFRFKGMKGVLAVDPFLDEMAFWARKNGIPPPEGEFTSWALRCVMRESQIKFVGAEQKTLEIVKRSTPVPVALNKPFINILDQVSGMQSLDCNRRVCNRIEALLDLQMRSFAGVLIDEQKCRNRLKEFPNRIGIDRLATRAGFELSHEPFFRSLIKAAVKFSITKQLKKEQIQIPYHLGRSMLGVTDETGRLQYGQVFVRYTKSINKDPNPRSLREVLTGPVLLTKNPCNVEGDVRIFEAVDIPELRHHCDVIVFPQHGPRSHPDEMAGSDLDGDEYSVIWDQQLLLEKNEEPFDYTADKRIDEGVTKENVGQKMMEFYRDYILQDSVGVISNAFLFQSDLYGITSTVCRRLARKIQMAVDFTKSGRPPKPLTTAWEEDEDTGEKIPPERPERNPDFHFGEHSRPVYESPRLIGRLYRELKSMEDVLRISEDRDEASDIKLDPLLVYPDWEEYRSTATNDLARYNTLLRNLMENYGIRTEAEIFSGCIGEMRNRISDKDQDDMSFYNTNQLIETKVTNIYKQFRENFFEEFGGWLGCTEKVDRHFADETNVLHRECEHPTGEMKKKAVAYYRVCYERAAATREKKLSFGWLAFDILAIVKQDAVISDVNYISGVNPIFQMLEQHNSQYLCEHLAEFTSFAEWDDSLLGNAVEPLMKYCRVYEGLDRVLFLVCEWASRCGLCRRGFRRHHFALLFILYGTNHFASVNGDADKMIELLPPTLELSSIGPSMCVPLVDGPRRLVSFLEFLASRQFARLPFLCFDPVGYPSSFRRGEWLEVHKAAVKTYYNLVFNLRFEELPLSTDDEMTTEALVRECEPFFIELPVNANDDNVRRKLVQKSGAKEIVLRRAGLGPRQHTLVAVSARGTLESLDRLRRLVAVKPQIKTAAREEEMSQQMVRLVYDNIMRN